MEIIKKDLERLKVKPNLENYNEVYKNFSWEQAEKELDWFEDGKLNIAFNAVDRHAEKNPTKIALRWISEKGEKKEFTFEDLSKKSNQFANLLKSQGIGKGDRVFIFLPRIPELYFAYLGILKTGAIASLMFAAFSTSGLSDRIKKGEPKILITDLELAKRLDEKSKNLLEKIIVIDFEKSDEKIISYKSEIEKQSENFEIEKMDRKDPALMMFTSCTAGTPVAGIILTHGAFVQQHITGKWVLDFHDEDVYWCTGDPGWVTGAVYGILAPLSAGVTSIFFEGRFDAKTWYKILQDEKISIWYTAPTALRMLKAEGGEKYKDFNFENLRHICSVGEALNPEVIRWSQKAFGLPVHDTYWQTETGAMIIANLPSEDIKIGSMGRPLPGLQAEILDEDLNILESDKEGQLALKPDFPAIMSDVWGNRKMFESYFKDGWYLTNDRMKKDKDGYFWFVARTDDVIKTAGERVGPFEVESALIASGKVSEAGVIGKPDKERGEIIKAFCVLKNGIEPSNALISELQEYVKTHLAGHAYPREIEFVEKLPRNRSGKIMRRLLKAKELGLEEGDTSTLDED